MAPSVPAQALPLIERAWLALDSDEEWSALLLDLQNSIRASGVGLTTNISPEQVTAVRLEWHGLSDACLTDYASYFYTKDPWTAAACRIWQQGLSEGRNPGVLRSDDMLPRRDLRRSEFGSDFMGTHHLADLCKLPLVENEREQVVLALTSAQEDGAFQRERLAILDTVLPHLRQCYRVRQSLSELREQREIGQLITPSPWTLRETEPVLGRVWIDAHGTLLRQDNAAGRLLLRATGQREPTNLTSLLAEIDVQRMMQALRDASWTGPLSFRSQADPLRKVLVVPHFPALGSDCQNSRAIVFLHAQGRVDQSLAELMSDSLGVSPSEFRVAQALERGASPKEIAADLGISYSTVRAHLLKLYRKLGVDSQVALVCIYRDLFDSLRG